MPKPNLTPDNVDALTKEINDLDVASRILEADAVAADFVVWLKSKFDLTAEQITYVDGYPEDVKKFYGYLFASGFLTRSPIIFSALPANPVPRRTKETRANLFGNVSYNDSDKTLDGNFEITLEFSLIS